ncbi:MAG: DUF86 domain-containing protein [Bacteroidetes bacterium]|nr:DUF86 domain-containing protein [Bacteroidota bacterium]
MQNNLSDINRLYHIRDCIRDLKIVLNNVSEYEFYGNLDKKYAVERILEIIGEAANHISAETLDKVTVPVEWEKIRGFRNLVAHEYFRIDYTIVYKIATESIERLENVILDLIQQLES